MVRDQRCNARVGPLLACVGVDATHFLSTDRVIPHDLVQWRRLGVSHIDSDFAAYIDVYAREVSYDTECRYCVSRNMLYVLFETRLSVPTWLI